MAASQCSEMNDEDIQLVPSHNNLQYDIGYNNITHENKTFVRMLLRNTDKSRFSKNIYSITVLQPLRTLNLGSGNKKDTHFETKTSKPYIHEASYTAGIEMSPEVAGPHYLESAFALLLVKKKSDI